MSGYTPLLRVDRPGGGRGRTASIEPHGMRHMCREGVCVGTCVRGDCGAGRENAMCCDARPAVQGQPCLTWRRDLPRVLEP